MKWCYFSFSKASGWRNFKITEGRLEELRLPSVRDSNVFKTFYQLVRLYLVEHVQNLRFLYTILPSSYQIAAISKLVWSGSTKLSTSEIIILIGATKNSTTKILVYLET